MTESEWLSGADPAPMLRLYTSDEMPWRADVPPPTVSARKLRLFACAFWRWHVRAVPCASLSVMIEKAEGLAERNWHGRPGGPDVGQHTVMWADAAQQAVRAAQLWAAQEKPRYGADALRTQAAILRDVVGNPWRPAVLPVTKTCPCECAPRVPKPGRGFCGVCLAPADCPWLTPDVLGLARAAYDERDADGTLDGARLAVLSDALEEAGCDCEPILSHLRGMEDVPCASGGGVQAVVRVPLRSPHFRGCWAIDLLLGKD